MLKITLLVLVTVVATINLSLAQSQNNSSSDGHQPPNFFGIPLPFQVPQFQYPQLPFFKEERAAGAPADAQPDDGRPCPSGPNDDTSSDHDHQDRFFFGLFRPASVLVSCNFTTQGGARCTSCTQALTCGSNNVGRLRFCRGLFPYCNLGRCSFFPGALCANATG